MGNTFILQNKKIVTPSEIIEGDIFIRDGVIADVGKALRPGEDAEVIDGRGVYVLPGFRDHHMHHMYGQLEAEDLDAAGIARRAGEVAKAKAEDGVTCFWLALFGGTLRQMEAYLKGIKKYVESAENGREGAKLQGAFIEGTFINVACRGAQAAEHVFRPDEFTGPEAEKLARGKSPLEYCREVVDILYETGSFKLANIVPDYGEPSYKLIEYAARKGIVVGMGHTDCHADNIRAAMERGLSFFVHFTNGPSGHNTKPFEGGGAYEGGVTLPIVKEFILDGFHVDYRVVLDVMKGSIEVHGQSLEHFLFVTDQLIPIRSEAPKGVFNIGSTLARANYDKGFIEVVGYEREGEIVPPPANTLCGSLSTMDKNFSNYLSIRTQDIKGVHAFHKGVSLTQAVIEGAKLCASNQAIFIGDSELGKIIKGSRADLVVGDIRGTGGNYTFSVDRVFVDGTEVFKR